MYEEMLSQAYLLLKRLFAIVAGKTADVRMYEEMLSK